MTLLWDNDPGAADRYNYAVGGDINRLDSSVALMRTLEDSPRENLVLIGPDVDMQSACDLSESVRVHRADVGVILLRRRLDVSVLGQALRAGVREVITADDLTGLADAVRRSRELSQKMAGQHDHTPAGGQGRHGLLRQGRRGQDDLLDQPRRLPRLDRGKGPGGRPGPRLR